MKKENFHSHCPDCKKLIPNEHFDCERKKVALKGERLRLIMQIREEEREKLKNYPMGVSNWQIMGEKYGYDIFFEKKLKGQINEILGNQTYSDNWKLNLINSLII